MTESLPAGVSVVVPVFNGAGTVSTLCERLAKVLRERSEPFEILLIDDCSRDESWQAIVALVQGPLPIRGLQLSRNYGQHNALLCGLRHARYAVTVTLDDDLQNPPEEVPKLLDALTPDFDVVYGSPERGGHGLLRNVASWLTKLALQRTLGAEVATRISPFRAVRTRLREGLVQFQGNVVNMDVLLTWVTSRFTAVSVRLDERTIGTSNYTLRKLLKHALNMITGFSTLPLQLASWVGFSCTALGIVALAYVVGRTLIFGVVVPGFAFTAAIIAIFSGAQLFALGVFGEYLARIHYRSQDRPMYLVRTELSVTEPAEDPAKEPESKEQPQESSA